MKVSWKPHVASLVAITLLLGAAAHAQDMEARAYSPAPVGTNFAIVSYGRTTGSVVLDPTIPITDASAKFNTMTLGYYHSFGLLGRQTSIAVGMPYVWGTANGRLEGVAARTDRSGLADGRIRLSYFLVGSPAVSPEEFKKRTAKTVIGASLTMSVPLGQYDPRLLINIGTNRWAFKPEAGFTRTLRSWMLELDLGAWFFTQNSNFRQGHVREQQPIGSTQGHVSYTFRPGLWVSLDGIFYAGGRTTLDGVRQLDEIGNSRLGGTLSLPLPHSRSQSLKLAFTKGATTRVGGNFTTISASYQFRFMTRR